MSEGRTAIIVALITAGAGLAGTIFANWDKISGTGAQPAPTPYVVPQPNPQNAEQAAKLSELQQRGMAGINSGLEGVVGKIEAANMPDVRGSWYADGGYRFDFSQQGSDYSFKEYKDGAQIGSGEGKLTGSAFTHSFRADGVGSGTCSGAVAPGARSSTGHCTSGNRSWDYTVTR